MSYECYECSRLRTLRSQVRVFGKVVGDSASLPVAVRCFYFWRSGAVSSTVHDCAIVFRRDVRQAGVVRALEGWPCPAFVLRSRLLARSISFGSGRTPRLRHHRRVFRPRFPGRVAASSVVRRALASLQNGSADPSGGRRLRVVSIPCFCWVGRFAVNITLYARHA